MTQYIDKTKIEEILRSLWKKDDGNNPEHRIYYNKALQEVQCQLDTLEAKEVDFEKEITNNDHKITIGTKIRLKTNPDVILSIISDDCHEDEFECSNGSVLSLKQIEKYYDIII